MVTSVTSLTGNGLKDWLIQRVTAVYFAGYVLFLFGFFLAHPHLDYYQWKPLFTCIWFKVASILALVALSLHGWIGIWTVTTDYISCIVIRLSVQLTVITGLLVQFIWGLMIIWGQ